MKDQKFQLTRFFYLGFLSFFGSGFAPKAPGTFGSLATIPLLIALGYYQVTFNVVLVGTVVLTIVSCFIAHYAQIKEDVHDPGWIVIDEVIGMLFTWLFVFPSTDILSLSLVFIFFRFFDIIKIFPANWCDKNIKNGAGTIIDDVISALYAGFSIKVVLYFLNTAQ